jgi:hypothetical protein
VLPDHLPTTECLIASVDYASHTYSTNRLIDDVHCKATGETCSASIHSVGVEGMTRYV